MNPFSALPTIGWREWVALPELNIPGVRAKIDTGARSSALHTHDYEIFTDGDVEMVRFHLHPLTETDDVELECVAPVLDYRDVKDSGGRVEERPFIATTAKIGDIEWEIEIGLSNRESMKYRMLLGRMALVRRFLVNPSQSSILGPRLDHVYDA